LKRNDPSKLITGPSNKFSNGKDFLNADGSKRTLSEVHIDARRLVRIDKLCHFLLLENEQIAGSLVLTIIQCLEYPDAYTCRRSTRIVHRILESVAWLDKYTELLGYRLLSAAVKAIVTEPKWMVGTEWDMINIIRDIYGRLVLGQYFLPGGQGPGLQMSRDPANSLMFEQTKVVDKPLLGGGILTATSDFPRRILMEIGMSQEEVVATEKCLSEKRSAKEQKDIFRDLLRVAADKTKQAEGQLDRSEDGLLGRAGAEESLLHGKSRQPTVAALPEKLVTYSMMKKKERNNSPDPADGPWHGNLFD